MCDCVAKNELEQTFEVKAKTLWVYDSEEEFLTEIDVNFCPFCGENFDEDCYDRLRD